MPRAHIRCRFPRRLLSTMRCETVAVGCHRLRIGVFEPFRRLAICHRLPPIERAWLYKCVTLSQESEAGTRLGDVAPRVPMKGDMMAVADRWSLATQRREHGEHAVATSNVGSARRL